MTVYEEIQAHKKRAEKIYKEKGGFISRIRLAYWRRKFESLTIGEATKQTGGNL